LFARDESKSSFAGPSPWQKVDVYKGQYMARNVAKDDIEAQREALSGHGYFAHSPAVRRLRGRSCRRASR
jgi:hypothetical protein